MTATPSGLSLVTGATGLLGSHIAETLRARGDRVRALVRPGTPTPFLDAIGVEVFRGDLNDPAACRKAAEGAEVVYHSAAKVGDWGTWDEFQVGCLDATRNIAEAALAGGARRFVQISSTSAYGHPKEGGPPIDETAPLGQDLWRFWDYYTLSKVESERLLWDMAEKRDFPLTIIRPSWLYGERDRITMARLITKLRAGTVPWIGPATNPISAIYAGNVADAAILAAGHEGSKGEAYNITHQGFITQEDYLNLWVAATGAPAIKKRLPYRLVFGASVLIEAAARLTRRPKPPLITRYATWLMGRFLSYSTEKAETKLGWKPALSYEESIHRSVRWYDSRAGKPT